MYMRNCQFCQTELQANARFCHHCGAKAQQALHTCVHCQHKNPSDAQFCTNCGSSFGTIPVEKVANDSTYKPIYPLDFRDVKGLGASIRQYFVMALDQRITEVHNPNQKEAYLNQLMQSDFQEIFKLRTNQLAEEAYTIHTRQSPTMEKETDAMLDRAFEGLLDFFFIKYCKDINEVPIPEAGLKYEGAEYSQTNLYQMVLDYLVLEEEDLVAYTDFLKMPLVKLQNAGRYYLFPAKTEKILLIGDQTVFGSCKEGFALTDAGIYWKAHFKEAEQVLYKDLETIQRVDDHLLINGHFFNAGASLNTKLIYLLKRLQRMF